MNTRDLLIEIGTEELPPKALSDLSKAFSAGIVAGLKDLNLTHDEVVSYATPRRLAVLINNLMESAQDRNIEVLGPPAANAKDDSGNWSKAAQGFARKHNVDPEQLEIVESEKGPRLGLQSTVAGASTVTELESVIDSSVRKLPIPKRMRWGSGRTEFVRPVHWALVLFGDEVIDCELLGLRSGNTTRGHRFHSQGDIRVSSPASYEQELKNEKVIVRFEERREIIREQVKAQAEKLGAAAVIDDDLLDEVTALVEWPVALTGGFEERFLQVPSEALIYSMQEHQKYFPVTDKDGKLQPNFITVSNIVSDDPAQVIDGNERVIRPRLSDADFFFQTDKKRSLADRVESLKNIVFQQQLGTLHEKSMRLVGLSQSLAPMVGADPELSARAALLAKTDLLTEMVGEFADMQGIAGRYYAQNDGEHPSVATALEQQYWPKYSGASLPNDPVATCLALADRLDTLIGIFGIGQLPTGSKDPFALRRASLGVLRILVEGELDVDLQNILELTYDQYPANSLSDEAPSQVLAYMLERFRAWYEDDNIAAEVFLAVSARPVTQPLDIHRRVYAVHAFSQLPQARALAAANKRVANILEDEGNSFESGAVSEHLLTEGAEKTLYDAIHQKAASTEDLFQLGDYNALLSNLADLQQPVDEFFDQVMVMVEDMELRKNRLQLLMSLRELFLRVADISLLAVSK